MSTVRIQKIVAISKAASVPLSTGSLAHDPSAVAAPTFDAPTQTLVNKSLREIGNLQRDAPSPAEAAGRANGVWGGVEDLSAHVSDKAKRADAARVQKGIMIDLTEVTQEIAALTQQGQTDAWPVDFAQHVSDRSQRAAAVIERSKELAKKAAAGCSR
jgi:hypothetical protein